MLLLLRTAGDSDFYLDTSCGNSINEESIHDLRRNHNWSLLSRCSVYGDRSLKGKPNDLDDLSCSPQLPLPPIPSRVWGSSYTL
jgi:hypothetical protein